MSLLDQRLQLMLYGMGTVFVFLTVLVFATQALGRVAQSLSPQLEAAQSAQDPDARLMQRRRAAAVAAVHRHRQTKL